VETKDFPDADWAAIKDRKSVKGHFQVEGSKPQAPKQPEPEAPEAPASGAKPARAKKG
jgi:hypothetical protein